MKEDDLRLTVFLNDWERRSCSDAALGGWRAETTPALILSLAAALRFRDASSGESSLSEGTRNAATTLFKF